MIRAVLDTNVLVSAMLAPVGNEAQALEAAAHRKFIPCYSDEIVEEYSDVLSRVKFGFPALDIEDMIDSIRWNGLQFSFSGRSGFSPDASDDKFIACAFAAQADFLVTGNRRHFPQEVCGLTKVVSARELLEALRMPGFR